MIPIEKITGRLGNQMFQAAALYAYTKDNDFPFFVQGEKYFKKYEHYIRLLFSSGIGSNDKVSIHVRRGDYVGNPLLVDLSLDAGTADNYYVRAMAMFPGQQFVVFSDDIEWCRGQEAFKDCEFCHGDEVDDMNAMASCKHNIIANSAFSWWAAWLNPNPHKIVIAPRQWFLDHNLEHHVGIPDGWVRI